MGSNYSDEFFEECAETLRENPETTITGLARDLGIPRTTLRDGLKRIGFSMEDLEIYSTIENASDDKLKQATLKLVKNKQRQSDVLRVERKHFRQKSRLTNALEEYSEELKNVFKKKNLSEKTVTHPDSNAEFEGIIQLSDLHINEQIELATNKYDIDIAAKRIQKHVDNAKRMFNAYGVKKVHVAFTGDLLNSNRRVDELLLNATNRANATFVAIDLLQQALLDLNEEFNLDCSNVTGNESRIEQDIGWIDDIAQDNFDFVVYNTLAYLFEGSDGITFQGPDDSYLEKIIHVKGQNILLIHGHNGFAKDTDKKIASKVGQYSQKGIFVDYVLFGHIHSAHISDLYARSSGLPGTNNYANNALDLSGKASQNLYILNEAGDIHATKVDLHNTDGYKGYKVKSRSIYDEKT